MPRGPIERSLSTITSGTFTGQSKFADGTVAAPSITFASAPNTGFYLQGNQPAVSFDGVEIFRWGPSSAWLKSDTGVYAIGSAADVILARDAANILALRNGVNGQAFRLYDSYTDESTHTGWELNADTAGSFLLRYRNNGTFSTVGTFTSGGAFTAANGVTTTTGHFTIPVGSFLLWSGRGYMEGPSDGGFRFNNNAGSNTYDIALADWGTTTSAKSVSVAIDGTLFFGTAPVGTLFVTDVTGNTTGQFGIVGTRNATAEIYDSNGLFSATKDTAASLNVYYDAAGASGAGYYLQNKRGAINAVRLTLIGG